VGDQRREQSTQPVDARQQRIRDLLAGARLNFPFAEPRSLVALVYRYLPMDTDVIGVLRIAEAEFGLPGAAGRGGLIMPDGDLSD
jgi:hypothetical protein